MFKMMPVESDPVVYAIPFFLVLISIELFVNWRMQLDLYKKRKPFLLLAWVWARWLSTC